MESVRQSISEKIEQAIEILARFGMPNAQLNERTAYCMLALLNVTPEKDWKNAENPLIGITPMMDFARLNYQKTSHGPVDSKRYIELKELFSSVTADLIFVSAFPDKATFVKFAHDIAWETEAWIAENPDHMIHFNGDKFLGPHGMSA